jgi:hypothetical protein
MRVASNQQLAMNGRQRPLIRGNGEGHECPPAPTISGRANAVYSINMNDTNNTANKKTVYIMGRKKQLVPLLAEQLQRLADG